MRRNVPTILGIGLVLIVLFAVPLGAAHADDATPAPGSSATAAGTASTSASAPPPATPPAPSTAETPVSPAPSSAGTSSETPPAPQTSPPATPTPAAPESKAAAAESPIEVRYREAGGATGELGPQTTPEAAIPGGRMAVYTNGEIRWSAATGARIVWPRVTAALDSRLGFPTNELTCNLVNNGCRQDFQNGLVFDHPETGTYAVLGAIGGRYRDAGREAGRLGYPTSIERCGIRDNGCFQSFQNGSIYWSSATGAQSLWGAISEKWVALGGVAAKLAFPTAGEVCGIRDNGCYQLFQGGIMYWSSGTGTHPVWGTIRARFQQLGSENGQLGLPTRDEQCGLVGGGCYQYFVGGTIHWSPATGAQATWNAIQSRWGSLGWEHGKLGYPTSAETCGIRDNGCYQRFQGGVVYWSRATGAQAVWGMIYGRYGQLDWERSPLGYPTTGESCANGTCRQSFQYGYITWSAATGARETYLMNAVIRATTAADVQHTYRSGCPVGASGLRTIEMNYWGFDGKIHRGVLIVKTSLAPEVVAAFTDNFNSRWRLAQMTNPNAWGGDDPRQMTANNTSGFNCRTVVGNPYAMSPHSYGIAIDSNTVQNPYRDRNGTWWPSNGRDYILGAALNRPVTHFAVMTTNSAFTRSLESRGWFWGGRWSPGRDYHHFEKR